MKIAVLISGLPRSFQRCHQFYKLAIGNPLGNPDIFISTTSWDITKQDRAVVVGDPNSLAWYPEDGKAEEMIDLYQPVSHEIEVHNDHTLEQKFKYSDFVERTTKFCVGSPYGWSISTSVLPMLYRFYRANQLRKEHERLNGFEYDIVIRTRSDLEYDGEFSSIDFDLLKKSRLILGKISETNHLADLCVAGSGKIMDIYCDLYWCLEKTMERSGVIVPEHNMMAHLRSRNITWDRFPFNLEMIR